MRIFTLVFTLLIMSSCNKELNKIEILELKIKNLEENYLNYTSLQWDSMATDIQDVEIDLKKNKNDYSSNEAVLFLKLKMSYLQLLKEKEDNEYNNLLLEWSDIIKNAEKQN